MNVDSIPYPSFLSTIESELQDENVNALLGENPVDIVTSLLYDDAFSLERLAELIDKKSWDMYNIYKITTQKHAIGSEIKLQLLRRTQPVDCLCQ